MRENNAAQAADKLPHWEEISAKLSRSETLTPLELFIHENEPGGDAAAPWRDQLDAALASAPVATPSAQHFKPPFDNCSFRMCDLPGQCRGEGKCHHPASAPVTEDDEVERIRGRGPAYPYTPNTAPPTPLASAPVAITELRIEFTAGGVGYVSIESARAAVLAASRASAPVAGEAQPSDADITKTIRVLMDEARHTRCADGEMGVRVQDVMIARAVLARYGHTPLPMADAAPQANAKDVRNV